MEDGEDDLQITLNPGKEWVAYIKSTSYNFEEDLGDFETMGEASNALKENLDLKTEGKVEILVDSPREMLIVLEEGSKLIAGEKWGEKDGKLHPVKEDD